MKDGKVCMVENGNVSAVYPLIYKKAQATWNKLPKHVQVYIGLEDLIQEGTNLAVMRAARLYRGSKKRGNASFVTFLYHCLDNYFSDSLGEVYAEKRKALAVYSLDSSLVRNSTGKDVSLLDRLKRKIDVNGQNEDTIIARIDSERAFLTMYKSASPRLRKYLVRWILQPSETKFKLYGNKFIRAAEEFHTLAVDYHKTREMCRCLWLDYEARTNVCRKIVRTYQTPTKKSEPVPFREDELRKVAFDA